MGSEEKSRIQRRRNEDVRERRKTVETGSG
jgi:hypothetical protein